MLSKSPTYIGLFAFSMVIDPLTIFKTTLGSLTDCCKMDLV